MCEKNSYVIEVAVRHNKSKGIVGFKFKCYNPINA